MKKLFFFTLAGVAAILSSCTKTETVEIPDSRAINFSGAYIGNAVETRTQGNPENITDASITEFIVYGGYNGMTDVFNAELVTRTSGGTWTYTNTEYWVKDKTYDFAAYAPAAVSNVVAADATNKALSFTDFTSDASNQNDLLYDHVNVPTVVDPSAQGAVKFYFTHALSKVRFTFTNSIDGHLKIEDFKFYGMNSKGDYAYDSNSSSMGWDNVDTKVESTAPFTSTVQEIATVNGTAKTGDFLVIPQGVTASAMTVTFTATFTNNSGDEVLTDKPVTATLPAGTWVPGQCYNYNLNITMDVIDPGDTMKPIVFSDPDVTAWPDEANDSDQDITL